MASLRAGPIARVVEVFGGSSVRPKSVIKATGRPADLARDR